MKSYPLSKKNVYLCNNSISETMNNEVKRYLAVDLGATSGRTVLATYDGEKISMEVWTRFENPQVPMTGHLFWNLPHLYNEILKALKKLVAENIAVESVGIDTWGCDVAFFGHQGQLLGLPFCYRDPHTDGAIEKFTRIHMNAEALYNKTGIQFMPFNTLFQLDTLRREGVTAPAAASHIMFMPDALTYLLTGRQICEYTIASTSQILDPRGGDLDSKLLKFCNISRKQFGPITQPGTVVGNLVPQLQQYTGMGPVPVVAVAGHDTASAVVSVPAQDANYAYLSCGTWSLLGIESPEPIITKRSRELNFTNEGGTHGTTRFLKNICGLWLLEGCRKEWGSAVPANVNELNALSLTSEYEGLIQPDAADFAHPTSMTKAIAEYCLSTGQVAPESPADYVRCIFRSLALRYRQVIEWLRELSTVDIQRLHVIGGGSLNAYLMQMTADATNLPVIAGPTEGTALGNVLMQLRASGIVNTLPEMRSISARSVETKVYEPAGTADWDAAYEIFKNLKY